MSAVSYVKQELFAINKIEINEIDCEMLKDDGIMLQRDRQNVINIFPFIEKVFPHSPEFSNFIHKKNAKKILKRFRMYKLWKVKRVKEDEFLNKIFGDDSGMGPRKSKVNTVSKGKGLSRIKNKEESKDVKIKTAKEMWEIQDPKKPEEVSPVTGKEKGKKGKKQFVIKSTEEKMSLLLPKKETVVQNTVHRQAIEEAILKILLEIVDNATSCGESLLLTKNVQRRFANRAVVKDNIVVVQEEGFGVSDIIPRSISSIPSIGRILYLSNEGSLNQFDLINSHQLANINLSSKVPMKKDEILDYLMDSESGLLYILKMSWILEMWNIFQKARTPAAKVRLALTNDSASLLTQSYKNRYLGTFPTFLSLSQNNRQILTVNCTMINGSIFFLDPISLSIVSQAKIRRDELHISDRLNKIFFLLKPFFAGLAKQGLTFEKIFANDFKSDAKTISTGRFEKYVMEELAPKVLSPDEIKDLIMFIDQSEDNELNETEWNFMQDNMRLAYRVNEVHAGYEIPDELKNMNLNVAKIFYDIYEYMQKQGVSLTETFKIFDSDNSGSVSEIEFLELMEEISKESTLEQRRQFFKFIDKDGSRSINIAEFNNLFKMFGKFSLQELLPSENPRLDLFSIIEKAFDCGIDLEAEFLKHDMYKDGGVEPHRFKLIILNLPFGLTEEDVSTCNIRSTTTSKRRCRSRWRATSTTWSSAATPSSSAFNTSSRSSRASSKRWTSTRSPKALTNSKAARR
jgi:hypothetical protein